MSFFETLVAATATERAAFAAIPQIRDGLAGRISRDTYVAYLAQAYHHVRHTVPLMQAARARLDDDHRVHLISVRGFGQLPAGANGTGALVGPVSGEVLRALSDSLVELHGQHDDRGLLNPRGHRALLDTFARLDTAAVAQSWRSWRDAEDALAALKNPDGAMEGYLRPRAIDVCSARHFSPGCITWVTLYGDPPSSQLPTFGASGTS